MSSLTKPAIDLLSMYAAYHRDRRNIATHFVGIPMIVLAVCILLARPNFILVDQWVTPIHLVFVVSSIWYLTRGAFAIAALTVLVNGLCVWLALQIAAASTAVWLTAGIGLFVLGWVIQFIGHKYEGRKPAFVDDLVGLLVGPMFLVAEAWFACGFDKPMLQEIERRVGPTRSGAAGAQTA
jgi:uncharacterized membrane protein YGL010W